MRTDKARLVIPGDRRTLAQRTGQALAAVCIVAVEVGPGWSGLTSVEDEIPGGGPLAALVTGWHAVRRLGHAGPVLVAAVDLPLITPAALGVVVAHSSSGSVVPVVDGRPQVLCARWAAAALTVADGLVANGLRSMRDLLERVPWTALRRGAKMQDRFPGRITTC